MTNKTIIAGLVALAFVAGSIMTSGMAYAAGDKKGQPFEALWDALHDIQTQIDGINVDDADSDPTNELQTLGQTDSSFGNFGLDLDDPNDSVSMECFSGYVGKLEISSCPGAVGCNSGDELAMSVNCKRPTLSVP